MSDTWVSDPFQDARWQSDELDRCDREIERICEEARAGIGDAHGIYQGLHDWRTEKKLIANESLPRTESPQPPEFKQKGLSNG